MGRSTKKGPYIDQKLFKKVMVQKAKGRSESIKTWARDCQIPPEFVGQKFLVHTGRDFKEIFVSEAMVGHRLGEFAATRVFRGHGQMVKRILEKT